MADVNAIQMIPYTHELRLPG